MITLAIESSAAPVSVCVCENGRIIAESYVNTKQTHSETLMPMVENVLDIANLTVKEIDLFAVSAGPGSFTGIRIGVSTVKGLTFANGALCCPVSTLEAIAYNAVGMENYTIVTVMDARCKQVYNANFKVKNGEIVRLCEDRALSISELADECKKIEGKILLCGDGAAVCSEEFKELNAEIAPENVLFQRASGVAFAAEKQDKDLMYINGVELVPSYLRLPQAERERKKRMGEV